MRIITMRIWNIVKSKWNKLEEGERTIVALVTFISAVVLVGAFA